MPSAKTVKKPAGPATRGLQVVSKRPSFWRAGIQFGETAKVVPLSDLTADQVTAIKNDPSLVAVEVDIEPQAQ